MASRTVRALILLGFGIAVGFSPARASDDLFAFRRAVRVSPEPSFTDYSYSFKTQFYTDGWTAYQMLGYQEHLDNLFNGGTDKGKLNSNSQAANIVLGGTSEIWLPNRLILGTVFEYPLIHIPATETWRTDDGAFNQTNSIKYGIVRWRGYLGYFMADFFEPTVGAQFGWADQLRENFVINGTATAGSADEQITTLSWMLGLRGRGSTQDPWGGGWRTFYQLMYTSPFSVQTVNDLIAGRTFSAPGGSVEGQIGVGYSFSPTMTLMATVNYLSLWYQGTGRTNKTDTVWPPNDTQDLSFRFTWASLR